MGMPLAFIQGKADFSAMTERGQRLFVDDVIHKAFVTVDEQGTEAAAATGVEMAVPVSLDEPIEPVSFRADHPFVYLTCDKPGNVLSMGRLNDPTAKGSD
jgi:serpin B